MTFLERFKDIQEAYENLIDSFLKEHHLKDLEHLLINKAIPIRV